MKKEKLQSIYTEAGQEALKIRASYRELEKTLQSIEEQMKELAEKGANYEAIVYHAIEVGADDVQGWMNDEEEDAEDVEDGYDDDDYDDYDDDDDDDDEDDDDDWYYPCDGCDHDCMRCEIR